MNSAPVEIAAWLGCLAFLLGIAVAIKSLLPKGKETREIGPQPLQVKNVTECVTEQVCRERHAALERELTEAKNDKKAAELLTKADRNAADVSAKADRKAIYDKIDELRKTDIGELHEKINDVAQDVSGLTTATELQNQQIVLMNGKLDRLIERKNS